MFVRQKDKPVKVLLVSAEVHKHFRSVKEVKQLGFTKVRIVFSDRSEANNVVYNELLSRLYRVYIPSERVEIDGVINQAEMDLNCLTNEGFGRFDDPRIPQVSILECQQLAEVQVEGNMKTYIPSNDIRVTFEGTILPDYVEIGQALIRVRVYTPKVMLCAKCKRFGHTQTYCSNKACCDTCGKRHTEGECTIEQPACLYCKGSHMYKNECPIYKKQMKLAKARVVQKSKMSYAAMVKAPVSQSFEHENTYSSLSDMSDFDEEAEEAHHSRYVPPKRKKLRPVKNPKRAKQENEKISFPLDQSSKQTRSSQEIPGFKKDDFPPLPPSGRNLREPETAQSKQSTDKFDIPQLIHLFAETFDLSNLWVNLLLKLTPMLKTILSKLITTLPLLGLFVSIDG